MGAARWNGLDGLRAIAVLAVLGTHFGFLNRGAVIGVDLFFVLSGFLITSLLLRERQRAGAISLRRFWLRRGLRLFPALLCAVLFALVMARWATSGQWHTTWTGLPWVFAYLGNWASAAGGYTHPPLALLGPTWSLAIEEQFYLVWPLLMAFWLTARSRPERAATIMASLACLAGLYNLWAMEHWGWLPAYNRSDTHAMGLCAGCALALAVKGRPEAIVLPIRARQLLQWAALGALALFCYICIFSFGQTALGDSMMLNLGTLSALVLVAFVLLVPDHPWVRPLSWKGPSWLGARSYGVYLYHYPLVGAVVFAPLFHFTGAQHFVAIVVGLLLTVLIAAASYRWVERPFLRLKERFSAGATTAPQPTLSPAT
jgi:peptidoglycan/LPS O-acetylase OafA/YrhL